MSSRRGRRSKKSSAQPDSTPNGDNDQGTSRDSRLNNTSTTPNFVMTNEIAKAFQNFIAQMITPQSGASTSSETREVSLEKGSLFEKFLKGNPPELSDPNDPATAEIWLNKMEKIFSILGCSSEQKVKFAEYKLQGSAENWWRMIKRQYEDRQDELTWEKFIEVFNDKYYPATVKRNKLMEFLNLKQGNMSVADYETKFVELSRFAPSHVACEEDRIFMFQKGLRPDILSRVELVEPQTYGESTKKATIAEQGIENEKIRQPSTKRDMDQSLGGASGGGGSYKRRELSSSFTGGSGQSYRKPCPKCGRFHSYGTRCDGLTRTCFKCGNPGHVQHECKFGVHTQQSSGNLKQPGERFGHALQTQSDPHVQKFNTAGSGQNLNQGQKSGSHGQVFALTEEQAEASPSVVQGQMSYL